MSNRAQEEATIELDPVAGDTDRLDEGAQDASRCNPLCPVAAISAGWLLFPVLVLNYMVLISVLNSLAEGLVGLAESATPENTTDFNSTHSFEDNPTANTAITVTISVAAAVPVLWKELMVDTKKQLEGLLLLTQGHNKQRTLEDLYGDAISPEELLPTSIKTHKERACQKFKGALFVGANALYVVSTFINYVVSIEALLNAFTPEDTPKDVALEFQRRNFAISMAVSTVLTPLSVLSTIAFQAMLSKFDKKLCEMIRTHPFSFASGLTSSLVYTAFIATIFNKNAVHMLETVDSLLAEPMPPETLDLIKVVIAISAACNGSLFFVQSVTVTLIRSMAEVNNTPFPKQVKHMCGLLSSICKSVRRPAPHQDCEQSPRYSKTTCILAGISAFSKAAAGTALSVTALITLNKKNLNDVFVKYWELDPANRTLAEMTSLWENNENNPHYVPPCFTLAPSILLTILFSALKAVATQLSRLENTKAQLNLLIAEVGRGKEQTGDLVQSLLHNGAGGRTSLNGGENQESNSRAGTFRRMNPYQ